MFKRNKKKKIVIIVLSVILTLSVICLLYWRMDMQQRRKIYDDMIDFAKYAFNKSHAACYAVVSFQTAYLKTYYPVEFMAALMTSVIDNTSKVAGYIYACKQMNIGILPPDVNESQMEFTVDNGKIRFAMAAIKSLG
ncbi:MAG: hypothetical protein UEK58_05475, partial [Merdibacter sp.]|nr:hypothetical protein [Merdibacter sp.]